MYGSVETFRARKIQSWARETFTWVVLVCLKSGFTVFGRDAFGKRAILAINL